MAVTSNIYEPIKKSHILWIFFETKYEVFHVLHKNCRLDWPGTVVCVFFLFFQSQVCLSFMKGRFMEAVALNLNYPCDNSPTVSQSVCLLRHTHTHRFIFTVGGWLHSGANKVLCTFFCKCVYIRQRYTHDEDIVTTELSVVQPLVYWRCHANVLVRVRECIPNRDSSLSSISRPIIHP